MKSFILLLSLLLLAVTPARAQWTSQSFTLSPGWNAVYLEVQPEPRNPDAVFSGAPILQAWDWTRLSYSPQFISDMQNLLPQATEWSTWFAPSHPQRALTNLTEVRGGRPIVLYLGGVSRVTWTVIGKPAPQLSEWLPSGYSLTGFNIESPGAPTFRDYFNNSPAHVGSPVNTALPSVRALDATGKWGTVSPSTAIQRGKAYWVATQAATKYAGPLTIKLPGSFGLDYGTSLDTLDIAFSNSNVSGNRTVMLRLLSSLPRPSSATSDSVVAGDVRLSVKDFNSISQVDMQSRWVPFDDPISVTVEPGAKKVLSLAVRRADFLPAAANSGATPVYQSLLEVRESGTRTLVPVLAKKVAPTVVANSHAGLWVGTVTVNAVSWAGGVSPRIVEANPAFDGTTRDTPRPTNSDFNFRVIIHVDENGTVRLLQKVMQVWQNGQYQTDPLNPGLLLPGTPGQMRLFTDEAAAAGFAGVSLNDGTFTARRISTPIFGIHQPVTLTTTGAFGVGGSAAYGTVFTPYDDSLNPFKHKFHPQHDNWNAGYTSKLPSGVESWTISRDVRWNFSTTHPFNPSNPPPSYGDSELGGSYSETLRGVHRYDLKISGKFLIRKVSDIIKLN